MAVTSARSRRRARRRPPTLKIPLRPISPAAEATRRLRAPHTPHAQPCLSLRRVTPPQNRRVTPPRNRRRGRSDAASLAPTRVTFFPARRTTSHILPAIRRAFALSPSFTFSHLLAEAVETRRRRAARDDLGSVALLHGGYYMTVITVIRRFHTRAAERRCAARELQL